MSPEHALLLVSVLLAGSFSRAGEVALLVKGEVKSELKQVMKLPVAAR
jgi:hypothetical protein